jgi:dihydrofolate synthase/folylpolyglutamate synthase
MRSPFRHDDSLAGSRLDRVLARMDALVDWERRDRSGSAGGRMRQSLAPIEDLLARLGNPESRLRAVLVAGTKGKGSAASLIAAGLRRAGRRTGLYTSPHVERVHERVRLGAGEIDDEALASALERALAALDAAHDAGTAGREATWFDVLTAAALSAFADAGLEWAVLECGLGGRLDSTNAVAPELSVVTNVDLEHTAILGSTRAAIAREKAAIARKGRHLLSGVGPPGDEAADAVAEVARALGADLRALVRRDEDTLEERNARLARAALDLLGERAEPGRPRIAGDVLDARALVEARLPGRLEILERDGVPIVLDGAHVASSLALVLRDLARDARLSGKAHAVVGMGADKDASALLKALRGRVDRLLCTSAGRGPYRDPEELAGLARSLGFAAEAAADAREALDEALDRARGGGWVLVTGSLHLVGRVRGPLVRKPSAC